MNNNNNLFSFDYETQSLLNKDGSQSRFSAVFGEGGNIMHTKKDSYEIVLTQDLSSIGNAFVDREMVVKPFSHRNGEVIGLNISLGAHPTAVGDKSYQALITVPNNGGGRGYLSIKEIRLICTNGMVRTDNTYKEKSIKIPHTLDYNIALDLMRQSLEHFSVIIKDVELRDTELSKIAMSFEECMFELNKWYFENEMPTSHKKDMTLADFRKALALDPESIKSIERYNQLKQAFAREQEYNEKLGLSLSRYTVFASCTNYLSRRIESSNSTAPTEVQYQRQAVKMKSFEIAN